MGFCSCFGKTKDEEPMAQPRLAQPGPAKPRKSVRFADPIVALHGYEAPEWNSIKYQLQVRDALTRHPADVSESARKNGVQRKGHYSESDARDDQHGYPAERISRVRELYRTGEITLP